MNVLIVLHLVLSMLVIRCLSSENQNISSQNYKFCHDVRAKNLRYWLYNH